MGKNYYICIYRGPAGDDYDYYESDKCVVKASTAHAAQRTAGKKFGLAEQYWNKIEVWYLDEDDFCEE